MHAVNNGPIHSDEEQVKANLQYFTEADNPCARNHDAAFDANYGCKRIQKALCKKNFADGHNIHQA